jgi:transcriptional regulator NrdR family protein
MRRTAQQVIVRRKGVRELQRIVVRVFNELRELGEPEVTAREVALTVFTLQQADTVATARGRNRRVNRPSAASIID